MEEQMMEVNEDVNEVKQEQLINPLDYVTIPVKDYRKLSKKVECLMATLKAADTVRKLEESREQYRIWWHEEKSNTEQAQKALQDAKQQIRELLGVEDPEKLADLQFEKGVSNG